MTFHIKFKNHLWNKKTFYFLVEHYQMIMCCDARRREPDGTARSKEKSKLSRSLFLCFSLCHPLSLPLLLSLSLQEIRMNPPLSLHISLSHSLTLLLFRSLALSLSLSISPSLSLCMAPSLSLSPCGSVYLFIYLSLSPSLPISLSISLCPSLSFPASSIIFRIHWLVYRTFLLLLFNIITLLDLLYSFLFLHLFIIR